MNLKNRKKEWVGEINFPGHNFIENDPKTLKANDLLIYKGQKLSNKYLRTIDEDARDEIAKSVFNYLVAYDFEHFDYNDKTLAQAFKSLKKYDKHNKKEADGRRYVPNSGTSGYQLYRHFFPNIIKIHDGTRPSIYDVVKNPDKLWATIRNRMGNTLLYNDDRNAEPLQYPMNISLSQILIGARNSGLASMGSIFKPAIAKLIYKDFIKPGSKVLDYSCGFGTRLLGLMSLGMDVKYCGYEPNTETYDNLLRMIDYFKFNAEIKKSGSESDDLFDDKFDFVFSSPPYFNVEIYCDEPEQCYNKFPVYEDWLEGYWRKTVKNIDSMLASGGTFAINIGGDANPTMKKMEEDLNRIIVEEGFELKDTWYMKTNRSHLSFKKGASNKIKLEGIYFYEKK